MSDVQLNISMNCDNQRISELNKSLYQISKSIRVLTHLSWDNSVREQFLALKGERLPEVQYRPFAAHEICSEIDRIRAKTGDTPADHWIQRQAAIIEISARMLSSCGTADFFRRSEELYGSPKDCLTDGQTSSLALAEKFEELLESFSGIDLGAPDPACHLAEAVADKIRHAVQQGFGKDAPDVYVVDNLSSNALAGAKRIRLRKTACFTDRDIVQLIHHEAFVHVATSLNGLTQKDLPLLAASHPGTTRTQEGLAVFAEFITGSMDLDRMRRLSDRILAIQMAIDGADFIQIFRFFEGKVDNQEQAFENAKRVFRGGVMTGGAPFTKDIVYLDGLLRVHNFFRAIVSSGRVDCIPLMFCGKLDIEDMPVLCDLANRGLCKPPKFLPEWARDRRFLLSYLAYSSFLNSVDMTAVNAHYQTILRDSPKVKLYN